MIGAGNVASHLAPAIEKSGAGRVIQVFSRNLENSLRLARRLHDAQAIDDVKCLATDADVYIVSLADDAIQPFIASLPADLDRKKLWVHTSGSVDMNVLSACSDNFGVFYPLQTFSKGVELNISEIPLFIEASSDAVETQIRDFGDSVFKNIYYADSEGRKKMHIAAVFACNFTNYLWTCSAEVLEKENLSFEVLKPLLHETLRKAFTIGPEVGQTGPARRGDTKIIEEHMRILDDSQKEIYRMLSSKIIEKYRHSDQH